MTLKGYFASNRIRFIGIVLCNALAAFVTIFGAYMNIAQISVLRTRKWSSWLMIILIYTIVLLSNYLFSSLGSILLAKQNQSYDQQVRRKILQHWFSDGHTHQASASQNRLTNDLEMVNSQYFAMIPQIIYFSSLLVFSILALLMIHWALLVVSLLSVVVSLMLPKWFSKAVQKAANNLSQKNKTYLKVTADWFRGIDDVQRYAAGEKLIVTMKGQNQLLLNAHMKQTKLEQLMGAISETFSAIFHFALFILVGFLIERGSVPFGVIAVIGSYSTYISLGMRYIPVFKGMMVGSKSILDDIDQETLPIHASYGSKIPVTTVAWQGLSLAQGDGITLHFPDAQLHRGDKVLVTGPSGSGKTTLFNWLLGNLKPTTGKIVYQDVQGQSVAPSDSQLTYVPQRPILFPTSILNNITMFDSKLNEKAKQVVSNYRFDQEIAQMENGFETMIDLKENNVSGGQRQKIVLARTIVNHTPIILADEATSAIDKKGTLAAVKTLLETDATVLFIAHNFDQELRQYFDREIQVLN